MGPDGHSGNKLRWDASLNYNEHEACYQQWKKPQCFHDIGGNDKGIRIIGKRSPRYLFVVVDSGYFGGVGWWIWNENSF